MGDFNANPNSKVIKKFAAGEYNTDRFVAVQEVKKELYKKSTMSGFKGIEKGLHIDYIFVSEDLEIVDVDIEEGLAMKKELPQNLVDLAKKLTV